MKNCLTGPVATLLLSKAILFCALSVNAKTFTECKTFSEQVTLAAEQISANNTFFNEDCETDCDKKTSVKIISSKLVEHTKDSRSEYSGVYEVSTITLDENPRHASTYLVSYFSSDIGRCTLIKMKKTKGAHVKALNSVDQNF
jgi:hypothetical protein